MTELGLLAQQVGVHERTLRRAVNDGGLRARRRTPRTLELPLSERQYVRRSWHLMATLRGALRTRHNVRLALLFGSAARGTDGPTSDIDVLVVLRDPALEHVIDLGEHLTAASGRPVDVVRLGDAAADPTFFADMVKEGRVIVDRDRLWPGLRARERTLRRSGRHDLPRRAEAALAGIDQLLAS